MIFFSFIFISLTLVPFHVFQSTLNSQYTIFEKYLYNKLYIYETHFLKALYNKYGVYGTQLLICRILVELILI